MPGFDYFLFSFSFNFNFNLISVFCEMTQQFNSAASHCQPLPATL